MNKTILLVNPPIYDFAAYDMFNKPLGLLYLASILRRRGYDVRLIDAVDRHHPALIKQYGNAHLKPNGTGKYHNEVVEKPDCLSHVPRRYRRYGLPRPLLRELLEQEMQQHRPTAVLITSMMTYWYMGVADTISLIREVMPRIPIALGGVYATLFPDHAKEVCRPDILIAGGKIEPVLQWIDEICSANRIGKNENSLDESFDAWPPPAYDLYGRLSYLTLITSLGCPYRCDYCASRYLQPCLQQLEPSQFFDQLTSTLELLKKRLPPQIDSQITDSIKKRGQQKDITPLSANETLCYHISFMDDALLARAENHIVPILRKIIDTQLPLRFHTPNGLHCRYITPPVAEAMHASRFEMIRMSYESSDAAAHWQKASDNKVSDTVFQSAVKNLTDAGYRPHQLEAYILTGLPGQPLDEARTSARAVHDLGVKIRLCQFSPIPRTKLFDIACSEYGVNPHEPLLHNNSILSALDPRTTPDEFQKFKDWILNLNRSLDA